MPQKKPLKFLIDESTELRLGKFLAKQNLDVDFVAKRAPGLPDREVVDLAQREQRILITNDKDFGQLIFSQGLSHCGVILFRMRDERMSLKKKRLTQLLQEYGPDLKGKYIVVEDWRVRIR